MDVVPRSRTDRGAEVVAALHERVTARGVAFPIRLWDGRELGDDAPGFRLVLRQPWSLPALASRSDLAAGEAYLAGDVDVEGSMTAALRAVEATRAVLTPGDLAALARDVRRLPAPPGRWKAPRGAVLRGQRHSRRRDAAAVRHHYDQDAEFFATFLDPQLVYSCAYFAEDDRSRPVSDEAVLARAQRRKLELVCRKLDLAPGERFLDVGCGWGSMVIHAARHHGVRATGVTLSPRQAEVARERAEAAGVGDAVEIAVADYRDVDDEFDAIASIGMVEHVGADQLDRYASHLLGCLAPSGRLLNHGITTGRRDVVRDFSRDRDTFIGRYVFPDGALVPAHRMVGHLERAGFEVWDVEQLRPHYARTLDHWVANLERRTDRAAQIAGDTAVRIWRAFMAGSVVGFERADLGVVQILATRPPASLPFGRDRMLVDPVGE